MDDWQDAAFSSRHMHNRGAGNNKSGRKAFDVRKTYGSYSIKCAAWQKLGSTSDTSPNDQSATLELYRLTENGQGVAGELSLPGAMRAAVILAASRSSLRQTISDIESTSGGLDDAPDSEEDDSDAESNDLEQDRFDTFEKNSFRSPKFWLQWNSHDVADVSGNGSSSNSVETGLGYLVFSGNDCRKFKGTLNCTSLKWKDVPITGHKIISRSESDTAVNWLSGTEEAIPI